MSKEVLKEGSKFYLINTGSIEEHVVAGSYKHGENRFYMFLPHGKVHNIGEAQVYATKTDAETEYTKRLIDSAAENVKAANKIKKNGMVAHVIPQEAQIPKPQKETGLKQEKK